MIPNIQRSVLPQSVPRVILAIQTPVLPQSPPPQIQYDTFSDVDLTTWLSVTELSKDVVLELTGTDVYDSHTALRHVHELQSPQHSVHVILPLSLRTNKGFTPWLINAKTKVRGNTVPCNVTAIDFYIKLNQHQFAVHI